MKGWKATKATKACIHQLVRTVQKKKALPLGRQTEVTGKQCNEYAFPMSSHVAAKPFLR